MGLLSVLLDIYSEVGMLVVVLFAFLENFQTIFFFYGSLHHFTIPPTVYKASNFSTFLPLFDVFCVFF